MHPDEGFNDFDKDELTLLMQDYAEKANLFASETKVFGWMAVHKIALAAFNGGLRAARQEAAREEYT